MLMRLAIALSLFVLTAPVQASSDYPNYCYHDSSREYMGMFMAFKAKDNPSKQERDEFFAQVNSFAQKGELAAVATLVSRCEGDPRKEIAVLRPLVANGKVNVPAMIYLGRFLSNANDPESLQIFDRLAASGQEIDDDDYWFNHASAVLRFAPASEANYRKSWALLRAWPFNSNSREDRAVLEVIYFDLTRRAVGLKLEGFLDELKRWDEREVKQPQISKAISDALRGTPYAKKDEPIRLPSKETADWIMGYMAEQATMPNNVKSRAHDLIRANFYQFVQSGEFNGIPTSDAHKSHFVNFDSEKPSEEHLNKWARIIVDSKRADLIFYDGLDPHLLKYFAEVDNKTLFELVLDNLKSLTKFKVK